MDARPAFASASTPDSTKELDLAKSRSTFGKRDREMAKAAKASAKRARREERAAQPAEATPIVDLDGSTADQLVIQLRELHDAFEDKRMSFEDFDARRTDLVDRIAVLMASQ